MFIVIKYLITAAVVVLVSELAKRSDQLGALVASLPLITFMVLIWLYVEGQSVEKISNHAFYTFWYVIPTLPMFLVLPYLFQHFNFWITLVICVVMTFALFVLWALLAKFFGVHLL